MEISFRFTFVLIVLSLGYISGALAIVAAETGVAQEATVLARLASPKDENPSATLINDSNLADFQVLIPDEVQEVIKSGDISLAAFRSLRNSSVPFDERWSKVSAERAATREPVETLTKDGFPRGFIFATTAKILQDSTLSMSQKGEQLLWNMQALSAARVSYSTDFTLMEERKSQSFSLRGTVRRIVPQRFRPDDQTGQLFRERIQLRAPALLKGLSWLTFRFYNNQEDVVWVHSPAIKKTRQITGSNRADPFLGSPVAVDDLFGFSGKIQTLESVKISEGVYLAPLLELDVLPLKLEEPGCYVFTPEHKSKASQIPETASMRTGAGVGTKNQLSEMSFIPRKLVRIELLQRDPYSLYGRQVVYLDSELLVPYYKFVYERGGALKKIVITAQAFSATPSGDVKAWLPASSFFDDILDKTKATVTYDKVRFCEQADASVGVADFDPKGLGQVEPEAGKEKVTDQLTT